VPTAIEEAMMMSLPVVSTDVGSVAELVKEAVTGWLVPPLDARALARAIAGAAEPGIRAEMGARARERAASLCSTEHCAETHLAAYGKALEHRAGRKRRRGRGVWATGLR
jgi:glycosyltransferase involved in cell wall biosynthesis